MKKILLAVHGLMNHRDHDINVLKNYLDTIKDDEYEEVKLIYLYNHEDHHTYKYKRQWNVLETTVKDYLSQGYEVSILGFSFSCSLVAKLQKKYDIHKMILISPTYKLIGTGFIPNYVKVVFKSLKMKWKYRKNKKAKSKMLKANLNHIIYLIYNVFKSLIINKKCYKYIKCPVLIMKGTNDEFVTAKAISKITKLIKSNYIDVKIYEGLNHTFIRHYDECVSEIYPLIYNFTFDK